MTNFVAVVGFFRVFFYSGLFARVSVGLSPVTQVSSSIGRRFTYGYCNFHMAPALTLQTATGCPIGMGKRAELALGTAHGGNPFAVPTMI